MSERSKKLRTVVSAAVSRARRVFKTVKHKPPKPGYCYRCGYDLRAGTEVCPECGAAPGSGMSLLFSTLKKRPDKDRVNLRRSVKSDKRLSDLKSPKDTGGR
jgi:predicted amidophosphoribosyltransferase